MTKFLIYSDGGARGNPGPGAYGFVIKAVENSKFKFEIFNDTTCTPPQRWLRQPADDSSEVKEVVPKSYIKTQNNIVYGSGYLGKTTNNQAEYQGILAALKFLKSQIPNPKSQTNSNYQNINDQNIEIECLLDSQLIVEQMNGNYKIKNEGLKPLYWEISQLIMDLGGRVIFRHIPREQNKEADKLVNDAIDKAL